MRLLGLTVVGVVLAGASIARAEDPVCVEGPPLPPSVERALERIARRAPRVDMQPAARGGALHRHSRRHAADFTSLMCSSPDGARCSPAAPIPATEVVEWSRGPYAQPGGRSLVPPAPVAALRRAFEVAPDGPSGVERPLERPPRA